MACENDVIQLVCNPYSRVAIYSASFGRTEHESLQCSQSTGTREESKCMRNPIIKSNRTTIFYTNVKKKISPSLYNSNTACLASYATETVMQMCHGRRRCSLSADSATFGRPCKEPLSPYLKVVYTCGEFM